MQNYDLVLLINLKDNFITCPYVQSIKEESKFVSAMSDGQAPFVSTSDIARVAMVALTSNNPPDHDYRVLGPELLNYNEVFYVIL